MAALIQIVLPLRAVTQVLFSVVQPIAVNMITHQIPRHIGNQPMHEWANCLMT